MIYFQRSYQIDYFCGWRYLLSAEFRNKIRLKWGSSLYLRSLCLMGCFASLVITSTAAVLLTMAVWNLVRF